MQELEYYKTIVQSFVSGVIFQDNDLAIIYCNSSAEKMLGLSQSQMMGKTSLDPDWYCIHEDGSMFPGHEHPAAMCIKTRQPIHGVIMGVRKPDESMTWLNINSEPIFLNGKSVPDYVVTSFNDITALKLKEAELERSNEELQRFAYVASHDLQEPLRKINTFLNLFLGKYGTLVDEKGKGYLDRVIGGTNRMKTLIDDLLQYSRIENQREEKTLLDPNEKVNYITDLYSHLPIEKRPIITFQNLPKVKGYKTLLLSLFQNLIGNGIKYNRSDKPRIDISFEETDKDFIFSIKDNGIGIEKEYYEKIFLPFERLHGKAEYGGSGVGLAICKKIVEKHKGKLWVISQLNEGSTFFFTLPK